MTMNNESTNDLRNAARAINAFLRHNVRGRDATVALCDLLEVTAALVRKRAVPPEPARGGIDKNYVGPVIAHGYRRSGKDATYKGWSRRFRNADAAKEYYAENRERVFIDYLTPADCDR